MQYIIHIKAYMTCFTKVDIMLLNCNTLQKLSLMNSWKVCYPKRLDSSMNLHTAAIGDLNISFLCICS